jgi:crotonobetainyl-CoA:carnitine CoA-transferase CaiB-like acyl-CoA transferase
MAELILDTIGRSELKTDPRFRTNDDRVANRDALDAIIGGYVVERSLADNLARFGGAGLPVAPVLSIADLIDHDYVRGRGALVDVPDADLGTVPVHAIAPRLSATPGTYRRPAPRLGEHTAEILSEIGEDARKEAIA